MPPAWTSTAKDYHRVKNKLRSIVFLLLAIFLTSIAHAQQPTATSQSLLIPTPKKH